MPDTTPSASRLGTLVLVRDSFSGAVKTVLPNSPPPEISITINKPILILGGIQNEF